jgi:hypothetical protein
MEQHDLQLERRIVAAAKNALLAGRMARSAGQDVIFCIEAVMENEGFRKPERRYAVPTDADSWVSGGYTGRDNRCGSYLRHYQ